MRSIILYFVKGRIVYELNFTNLKKSNFLTPPLLEYLTKNVYWDNSNYRATFHTSKTKQEVGNFLQEVRDMLPTTLLFALRKNGFIYTIDHSLPHDENTFEDNIKFF